MGRKRFTPEQIIAKLREAEHGDGDRESQPAAGHIRAPGLQSSGSSSFNPEAYSKDA